MQNFRSEQFPRNQLKKGDNFSSKNKVLVNIRTPKIFPAVSMFPWKSFLYWCPNKKLKCGKYIYGLTHFTLFIFILDISSMLTLEIIDCFKKQIFKENWWVANQFWDRIYPMLQAKGYIQFQFPRSFSTAIKSKAGFTFEFISTLWALSNHKIP